jgi:hypothetical protein
MSFIYTPLATDNFTPNANPLNPAHWTAFTGDSNLKAQGGVCLVTTTGNFCGEAYTGVSLPNDQYVQVTLSGWIVGDDQEANIYIRGALDLGVAGYGLALVDNSDGSSTIVIFNNVNDDTLAESDVLSIRSGDVYLFAAIGNQLSVYQNGNLILSATDSSFTSGLTGLETESEVSTSDITFSNFITGSVTTATPGGPITKGAIFPGPYYGSTLATAFPNNILDIFQVVNEGGQIIWNLNYQGVATFLPSSPTPATRLGKFEGNTFAAAFPNPYQLNVFQLIGQGGAVVFHVDYQGNAVTP